MVAQVSERQKRILDALVNDYINSARPVSSTRLFAKYNFGVCPATIRNEMSLLTERNYLYQPYLSSGRIPTDKGYRVVVDEIVSSNNQDSTIQYKVFKEKVFKRVSLKRQTNKISFAQEIARILASYSSYLVLTYLLEEGVCFKEGLEKVLGEPEFGDTQVLKNFGKAIRELENKVDSLFSEEDNFLKVKVYIGQENFIDASKDFSLVVSRSRLSKKGEIGLAILGPKRMAYKHSISLLQSMAEALREV